MSFLSLSSEIGWNLAPFLRFPFYNRYVDGVGAEPVLGSGDDLVELPNGKMKSREGTVVDADDLMAEMIKDARQTSDELGKFKDMSEEERLRRMLILLLSTRRNRQMPIFPCLKR